MVHTQEEIDNKTIAISVNTAKMTGRVLQSAIRQYLNHRRSKNSSVHKGKQSIKKLVEQGAALQSIDITEKNIKSFESVAKKYSIDYALKKDNSQTPPKYIVFFKSGNLEVINMAFNEYAKKQLQKQNKPSIRKTLSTLIAQTKAKSQQRQRTKQKDRGNER